MKDLVKKERERERVGAYRRVATGGNLRKRMKENGRCACPWPEAGADQTSRSGLRLSWTNRHEEEVVKNVMYVSLVVSS